MEKRLTLKISISGVRGVVGESLTPQLSARFTQAFGSYLGRGRVIVGQDARTSGTMIKNAVFSGLLSVGCQPVDVGICPIPSLMILTKESNVMGGIAVTASHNPQEWNGLKFINGKGLFLNHSQIQEFLDIYHQGEFSLVHVDKYKSPLSKENPTKTHLDKLLNTLNVALIKAKRFKVVADCSNGAGAVLMSQFLGALGCQMVLLNCTPDGAFAHHPEPVPENITKIRQVIREEKADIGFVQDADADRLAIVNESGKPIGEELTVALAAKHILSKKPGPVIVNLSTTRAIDDIAKEFHAPVYRTKIGEIHVVEEIIKKNAVIGGEGNGGVIFPAVHTCRDSFVAMGLTLELMASTGKKISQLQEEMPEYHMVKDKVEGTPEEASRILREVKKKYSDGDRVSTLDGLKILFEDAWVHIRPSNTEPIIRILAEAKSRSRADGLLRRIKKEIQDVMKR